jgi:hypothetical protein
LRARAVNISLETIVLASLDRGQRDALRKALHREITKAASSIKNRGVGDRLAAFAHDMPYGDNGILEAATFLSDLCFGNKPVAPEEYTFEADRNGAFWKPIGEAMNTLGFAIVHNYLSSVEIEEALSKVEAAESKYKSLESSTKNIEGDDFYLRGEVVSRRVV